MACKHGLSSEQVCSLCKGLKQDQPSGVGPPGWIISAIQLAMQSQYIRGTMPYETAYGSTSMSHGASDIDAKKSLPYRKRLPDNKTRRQYEERRKEEKTREKI